MNRERVAVVNEYNGEEALSRIQRLIKTGTNAETWETEFRDEATGETWILDYPHSHLHGGGSPRLRKTERK
ncbi:MAG: Imm27 family immunity protein, partial [Shinella sp.]